MKIKAIVWDLGGVVIDFDFTNFYNKIISQSPLNKPQTPIMLEFFRQSDIYHQGNMSDDEFYQLACDLLQVCMLNQSEFFDAFNSIISGFNSEIVDIIRQIRDNNRYKLIALSNVNASHWDYIMKKKWEFIDYFEELILSHEIHLIKPDPKVFNYTIQKAGCKPKRIVFIDDGLNNIRSARELGIRAIHYSNFPKLLEELKNIDLI